MQPAENLLFQVLYMIVNVSFYELHFSLQDDEGLGHEGYFHFARKMVDSHDILRLPSFFRMP